MLGFNGPLSPPMKMFVIQIDDVFMAKIIKIRATHWAKTVNKLANECRLTKIEKIVLFPNVSDRPRTPKWGGEGVHKEQNIAKEVDSNLGVSHLSPEVKTPTSKKQVNNCVHISNQTMTEVYSDDGCFYNTENWKRRSFNIQSYPGRHFICCLLLFLTWTKLDRQTSL